MGRTHGWLVLAGVLAACGTAEVGGSPPLPASGGMALFVLPEVPGEEGGREPVPEVPVHLVFDGAGSFGLAGPDPRAGVEPAGEVEGWGSGRVILSGFEHSLRLEIAGPSPGRMWGWDGVEVERVELAPEDADGDGVADRLRAAFSGTATHFSYDTWDEVRPFTSTVSAAIEPARPGEAEVTASPLSPTGPVTARFELPAEVTGARIRTAAGDRPVSWQGGRRTVEFVPEAPLPWGETVVLAGEARVPGSGGEFLPFEVPVPVLPAPEGNWEESFEAPDLRGLLVARGSVEVADGESGVPPLDGARFLLVANRDFELLLEIEVPATDAPVLRLDARFAFASFEQFHQALPEGRVEVFGPAGRARADFGGRSFDEAEAELPGPGYVAASPTAAIAVPLAGVGAGRAVVSIAGTTFTGTGGFNDAPPAANGHLQLDGLRVVP